MPNPARPQQRHVGLIYRIDDSGPQFCHLAWHFILKDEPLPEEYYWGPSGLDEINKPFMAAYIALLKQNAKSIPYGISYTGIYFDDQGQYIVHPIGYGLTCATFILAVFERNGFNLLQTKYWPSRPEDSVWQEQILNDLQDRGASSEHVEAARKEIGAARYRPEEVAAGVISDEAPLSYPEAESIAKEIIEDLYGASAIESQN